MSLVLSHLGFCRSGRFALEDISMVIEEPVTALVGPNGAGKSTLVHCLANQLPYRGALAEIEIGWRLGEGDGLSSRERTRTFQVAVRLRIPV